jgi:hypothetical protein
MLKEIKFVIEVIVLSILLTLMENWNINDPSKTMLSVYAILVCIISYIIVIFIEFKNKNNSIFKNKKEKILYPSYNNKIVNKYRNH